MWIVRIDYRLQHRKKLTDKTGNQNDKYGWDYKPLIVSCNSQEKVTPRQSPSIEFENISKGLYGPKLCTVKSPYMWKINIE